MIGWILYRLKVPDVRSLQITAQADPVFPACNARTWIPPTAAVAAPLDTLETALSVSKASVNSNL